ncbi:MAG: sterol desaturase family protein [Candidatus Binatia bacterium]
MTMPNKREELFKAVPSWYSGSAHFALINVVASAAMCLFVAKIEHPTPWYWLFVPPFFVFANWFEWWVHRGPMHHPTRFLRELYRRHTLQHHVVFTEHDMAVRNPNELYHILFPWWFLPAILVANLPIPILLGYVFSPDLGRLFVACTLAYYLVYEWFHTLHHLPPESWLGRRAIVGWLRNGHARHHDPARMVMGNFNVSFPLWDYILGSTLEPSPRNEA